jgi:hypothetical protein
LLSSVTGATYPPVLCGNCVSILLVAIIGSAGGSFGAVPSGKERVSMRNFVLLSVGVRPFLRSLFPGKFAVFFPFDPLPNLFFDKVGNPVERIGIHYGRDLNVFFSL